MNHDQADIWKSEVLDRVLVAASAHVGLREAIVFKGARVLAHRLGGAHRQSLDLDGNLSQPFANAHPNHDERCAWLDSAFRQALRAGFEHDSPVRFTLHDVKVTTNPTMGHPRGWTAYDVRLTIGDARHRHMRGLPSVQIDIAAPENLTAASVAPLRIGSDTVIAYATTRIAGEKLRAFLQSLHEYRAKVGSGQRVARVKDVYDLHVIHRHFPLPTHEPFWGEAAKEFASACRDRFVDCDGMVTFERDLDATRAAWASSVHVPTDVSFESAWDSLRIIVAFVETQGVLPIRSELPVR